MKQFPARIHVLLARDSPTGVIIRRGPSKVVATVHWNRNTDEFRIGQWMKGRIYERRSDLSPDGKHLIYFALNGNWHGEMGGSWTAVSRAPYLKAIEIYADDCWLGGGLWTSNKRYWLNNSCLYGRAVRQSNEVYPDDHDRPIRQFGLGCEAVYYPRLLRDGWRLKESTRTMMGNCIDLFQKQVAGTWILNKYCQSGSEEHELCNVETGVSFYKPDWEWADCDRDRLIWASEGKLFSARLGAAGMTCETELHDFNSMRFSAIEAPY
jgi:hypothetical protein